MEREAFQTAFFMVTGVGLGSALFTLFLVWRWGKEPSLGWFLGFFASLAGIGLGLHLPSPAATWVASLSQVLYLVFLPGFVLTLTQTKPGKFFWGTSILFNLFLVLAMPSPWQVWPAAGPGAALGAFGLTGAWVVFLAMKVAHLPGALPKKLFRRFLVASGLMIPPMACDSLGSLWNWGWVRWFDQLALPAYLLVISVLVVAEAQGWLWHLAQPAPEMTGENDPGEPGKAGWEFSPRQRQIAAKLLEGLTSKEIGAQLNISTKTAENHIYALFRKVGAKSRVQFYHIYRDQHRG